MSVPPYFPKASAAIAGAIGDIDADDLEARLEDLTIVLHATADAGTVAGHRSGFLAAANLAARLYPRIVVDAEPDLAADAEALIASVNPACDLAASHGRHVVLGWGHHADSVDVTVDAAGWNVYVDTTTGKLEPAHGTAALAAAALGLNEIFRLVFANELGDLGRTGSTPCALNLVTLGNPEDLPFRPVDIGNVHLAGGGAIGQAALLAFRDSDVSGTITVVDPERLDRSNLQRYLLSLLADDEEWKISIAVRRASRPGLDVHGMASVWANEHGTVADMVLCGTDSAESRRQVQATLPRSVYNAYTSTDDIGWSRHEHFGTDTCLGCLYWPTATRQTRCEEIGASAGLHPLRVSIYLATRTAVGSALPAETTANLLVDQEVTAHWHDRSVLDDIADNTGRARRSLDIWDDLGIDDLYRQAICGGALLDLAPGGDVVVPLAHESLLAGVMLAVQAIVARDDELRARRPRATEGRWNLRAGPGFRYDRRPQRRDRCICADSDYREAYERRWDAVT